MSNIELTDIDGDALTIISREESAWITCTSGPDEVTVGPFPTRLVRGVLERGLGQENSAVASLLKRTSPRADGLSAAARERAWDAFSRQRDTASARHALDSALAAAIEPPPRTPAATELSEALRRAEIVIDDPDELADHLLALGYRRERPRPDAQT